MLTDLLPRTSWLNGGHIAVGRQYLSQQLSRDFVGARLTQRSVTRLNVIDSSLSHRVKSRGACCIGKLPKGRYRQVVVGGVIVGTPVIGQEEHAGRSAPSASSKDLLLTGIDETPTHKSTEMATYRRRCQTKTIGQFTGRRRTIVQDGRHHTISRGAVRSLLLVLADDVATCDGHLGVGRIFHNSIVAKKRTGASKSALRRSCEQPTLRKPNNYCRHRTDIQNRNDSPNRISHAYTR